MPLNVALPGTGTHRTERSMKDKFFADRMGIGTSRESERVLASLGDLEEALPVFEHSNNVCNAGVLFLLPFLLAQGLLKGEDLYKKLEKGYYGLVTVLLFLAFMALSRIKTPEQLKNCKVGEFGKILGLDRCPEAKCLRRKIGQIVTQSKAQAYNRVLASHWLSEEGDEPFYFYIDGHVRVYHGRKANLAKKFVSREKLCLAGTTEYWINNQLGIPYLVVIGQLNEKLKVVITEQIIPILVKETSAFINEEELIKDSRRARFTIIFDREAYEPSFFKWLWEQYRIAVITYRKNVKDKWSEDEFKEYETEIIGKNVKMKLAERNVQLSGMEMREIRKQSDSGHQTSIVTTNRQLDMELVGGKMFSRWSQENFFRYMVQDYDIDKMVEYGVDALDPNIKVVNPSYTKLTHEIKKSKEKQSRLKAKFYKIVDENLDNDLDELRSCFQEQSDLRERIQAYQREIDEKTRARKKLDYYITINDMPAAKRYNKLKTESKLFMNTVKMIAYRAETAIVNLLRPYYRNSDKEGRMLVKEIIQSDADLIPDYQDNVLTVRLHSLSTPRANRAAAQLCKILNETDTIYPNSDLNLLYETV